MTPRQILHSIFRFHQFIYDAYYSTPEIEECDYCFSRDEIDFAASRLKIYIKKALKNGGRLPDFMDVDYARYLIDIASWLASGDDVFYGQLEEDDKSPNNVFYQYDDMINHVVASIEKEISKNDAR